MQIAIVESGVVVALAEGDEAFANRIGGVIVGDDVQVGWVADAIPGNFRPPYGNTAKFRFLFELLHPVEQLVLDATFEEALALNKAQMLDQNMDQVTADLVILRNVYRQFDALDHVELGSPGVDIFLQAAGRLGILGTDPDLISWRIEQIKQDQDAPQLLVAPPPEEDPAPEEDPNPEV